MAVSAVSAMSMLTVVDEVVVVGVGVLTRVGAAVVTLAMGSTLLKVRMTISPDRQKTSHLASLKTRLTSSTQETESFFKQCSVPRVLTMLTLHC